MNNGSDGLGIHGGSGGGGGYTSTHYIDNVYPKVHISIADSDSNTTISAGDIEYVAKCGTTTFYTSYAHPGCNGGSAGGYAGWICNTVNNFFIAMYSPNNGASDGANESVPQACVVNYDRSIEVIELEPAAIPYIPIGKGQGTTTRAFGESDGTLYAGGGGGGDALDYISIDNKFYRSSEIKIGFGGAGGGGNGSFFMPDSDSYMIGLSGLTNTGGGGGGSGCIFGKNEQPSYMSATEAGSGGSGICIIRWGY